MAEIILRGGQIALVDDADLPRVEGGRWYAVKRRNGLYVAGRPAGSNEVVYLHRHILQPPVGLEVDHITPNGLDNRRCNLRVVVHQINQWNFRRRAGPSGYIGVSASGKNWRATISRNGKKVLIGVFPTAFEAAQAYDYFSRRLRGDEAVTNFGPECAGRFNYDLLTQKNPAV